MPARGGRFGPERPIRSVSGQSSDLGCPPSLTLLRVKSQPEGLDESKLFHSLAHGWGLEINTCTYLAEGFGSYHWIVTDAAGRRHFVTVDDLDHKGWLGETREAAFQSLRVAFDTALALRQSGLEFVVAPLPTARGQTLLRIGPRHTLALFPFVDGSSGRFGEEINSADRAALLRMLMALHQATPATKATRSLTQHQRIRLPGRRGLERALMNLEDTWAGGPFAEPARDWLARHATSLRRLLNEIDCLDDAVTAAGRPPVITHGEPHPGNLMRVGDGLMLVDWDTVGLAPPERDLWMVATAGGEELALYVEAAHRDIDEAAMSLYRLSWNVSDIAAYMELFQSPHGHNEDTERAWINLTQDIRLQDC